jgi:hypothetical protein
MPLDPIVVIVVVAARQLLPVTIPMLQLLQTDTPPTSIVCTTACPIG